MTMSIRLIKGILHIVAFFKGDKYKYSQEYEDNFRYMSIEEKLWWGYKALIKQIERGEKGKNIEEYFLKQNLDFSPEVNFKIEKTLTITAGGDLSASDEIYPENTRHLWDDIEDFLFSGDIVCANLEAPIDSSKPPTGVPMMCLTAPGLNTTKEMFEVFTKGGRGINFLSTANNHSVDQGEYGLIATLDFLDSKGYGHVGTSRTKEEQMDIPVIEKNGIRVAMLSYTYSLNGFDAIPGKEYMTNLIRLNKPETDISLIKEQIKIAHQKNADIIVAMMHWSIEFETYPIQNVIDMGHRLMECGVDIILGGHPHVAQPMERYEFIDPYSKERKQGFIVYSLGELVSLNAFSKNSRLLFNIKLQVSKGIMNNNAVTKITALKVLPVYLHFTKPKSEPSDYRLLDLIKLIKDIGNGKNLYNFNLSQIEELKRLEKLFYNKLLPSEHSNLLEDRGEK